MNWRHLWRAAGEGTSGAGTASSPVTSAVFDWFRPGH